MSATHAYHQGMEALLKNGVAHAGEYAGFSGEQIEIYQISPMSAYFRKNGSPRDEIKVGSITGLLLPGDVVALINTVSEQIATLQASVDSAPNMDPAQKAAWTAFAQSWKDFDKSVSIVPILYQSKYHDVVNFQVKARGWEPIIKAARGGALAGPSIQPNPGGGGQQDTPYWTTSRIVMWTVGGTVVAALAGWFAYNHYIGKPLSEAHAARRALAEHARSADPSTGDAAYAVTV